MDNVETVQKIFDCFGRGDIEGLLEYLDPQVEWEHDWGVMPPALYKPRRGRDEVRGFFQDLAAYDFLRFEPVEFLSGGNMVAVPIRLEMRHKETGKTMKDLEVHLWTFGEDGKVTRMRHVLDGRQFE